MLHQEVAGFDLAGRGGGAPALGEELLCAGERLEVVVAETGGGFPGGFLGVGVVVVRDAARVRETDFPARLPARRSVSVCVVVMCNVPFVNSDVMR